MIFEGYKSNLLYILIEIDASSIAYFSSKLISF